MQLRHDSAWVYDAESYKLGYDLPTGGLKAPFSRFLTVSTASNPGLVPVGAHAGVKASWFFREEGQVGVSEARARVSEDALRELSQRIFMGEN